MLLIVAYLTVKEVETNRFLCGHSKDMCKPQTFLQKVTLKVFFRA